MMKINYNFNTKLGDIQDGCVLYVDDLEESDGAFPVLVLEYEAGKGKFYMDRYGETNILSFVVNSDKENLTVKISTDLTFDVEIIDIVEPEEWEFLILKK